MRITAQIRLCVFHCRVRAERRKRRDKRLSRGLRLDLQGMHSRADVASRLNRDAGMGRQRLNLLGSRAKLHDDSLDGKLGLGRRMRTRRVVFLGAESGTDDGLHYEQDGRETAGDAPHQWCTRRWSISTERIRASPRSLAREREQSLSASAEVTTKTCNSGLTDRT